MKTYRSNLEFSDASGPAVIVDFDGSWRLLFWSVSQYVPCWDLGGNVWFTPEWLETNSPDDNHAYEPIMDKKLRYTKVEIINAGEARARIHWHYALCNPNYQIFNGNTTADEYYTVYPDGIAVRKLVGWPGNQNDYGGNPSFWEVGEWILVNGKGTNPEENLKQEEAFVFQNLDGSKITIPYPAPSTQKPLCESIEAFSDWEAYIGVLQLRNRASPFIVVPNNKALFPHRLCTKCSGDHPPFLLFSGKSTYRHWPTYRKEDFTMGLEAGEDKGKVATHTSICSVGYSYTPSERPSRPTVWLFLTGAFDRSKTKISDIASSWLKPANIEVTSGVENRSFSYPFLGYRYSERAYRFMMTKEDLTFVMKPKRTVVNPVLEFSDCRTEKIQLSMDGEPVDREAFKSQKEGNEVIVWLNLNIEKDTEFKIST